MSNLLVIKSLAEIAREMRLEGRINRTRVGALAGKSSDTVGEFEKGGVAPHVDPMVNAIAEDAGVSPVDLWMAAINRAALQEDAPGESVRFAAELGAEPDEEQLTEAEGAGDELDSDDEEPGRMTERSE